MNFFIHRNGKRSRYYGSIGVDFLTKEIDLIDVWHTVNAQIWDTAGQGI
jgi:hypothetical protein